MPEGKMGPMHYGDMKLGGHPSIEHVMGDSKEKDDDGDFDADEPGMGHAHELIDAVHAKDGKRVLAAMKMLHKLHGSEHDEDSEDMSPEPDEDD